MILRRLSKRNAYAGSTAYQSPSTPLKAFYKESFVLLKLLYILYIAIFLLNSTANKDYVAENKDSTYTNFSLAVPVISRANAEQFLESDDADTAAGVNPPANIPPAQNTNNNERYTVQAVLGAKRQIVLASGIDAKITKLNLESGDHFKKNTVLVEYDCTVDHGRLNEVQSRQRVTEQQLNAYKQLAQMDSASKIELLMAEENNEQNKALITQIKGRLQSCKHIAPWDGRVTRKMASQYEYVQNGRILMEISSLEPLRAEFLVPSRWLRWLNIETPLNIHIGETGRNYAAKIVKIHGEVDPVSRSIQVVAEMEEYHEDLLPGMSGQATFSEQTVRTSVNEGFLGLSLLKDKTKGTP